MSSETPQASDRSDARDRLRSWIRDGLDRVGALGATRRLRRRSSDLYRYATNAAYRQVQRERRQRFHAFRMRYQKILSPGHRAPIAATRRVLVRSRRYPAIEVELSLIKALQARGYEPVVGLARLDSHLRPYYELAGVREIVPWEPGERTHSFRASAETLLASAQSIEGLKGVSVGDVRIGMNALLSAMRRLRTGELDLNRPADREAVLSRLAFSLAAASWSADLVTLSRPDFVLTTDMEYTPEAELLDTCLARGIPVIKYGEGHRDNTLTFWRYTAANRADHFWSLSPEAWDRLRAMDWTEDRRSALREEFRRCYATGDWYSVPGTQRGTRVMTEGDVRAATGLDDARPTAVIFSHIPWDSSFRWGKDLFRSYEDWLIETVRAASRNERVQWRIKVHPAHVGKGLKEGFSGEPAEVVSLRHALGDLPPHVRLIPADTPISTWSLLPVMDYCVTVRGTIGIEAAAQGIPVLTAGTGRYDRKGFTIDSASREDYLKRLACIEEIPPLSEQARTLAERFAYGLFLCRPMVLSSVTFGVARTGNIGPDRTGTRVINLLESSIRLDDADAWGHAPDLNAFVDWLAREEADLLSIPAAVERINRSVRE